jgi:NitT/TauT family transport system ATP-binding protein
MTSDADAPVLRVDGVTLQYKTTSSLVTACYRVSFKVWKGERFVLLGPSGCGKSSLLKAVGGYVEPVAGSIALSGRPITAPGPDRMMVFQEFDQLLPWKTVLENVMFGMIESGKFNQAEARVRALAIIGRVGLAKFADVYPHMLSGGMKQRVGIARAMVLEPEMLLMDEPFAALDALTRRQMQDELLDLWKEKEFAMLFVTHSIQEAIVLGTRVLVLSAHPGQVRAELDCSEFDHSSIGSSGFQSLSQHISDLLFGQKNTADGDAVHA